MKIFNCLKGVRSRYINLFLLFSVLSLWLTVPGIVSAQVVDIPDPNLRAAIAAALNQAPGDATTRADMETLVELEASFRDITDLRGIEFAINLRVLWLEDNTISDISPLSSLTNLTSLGLSSNSISDISPVASLTNLTSLGLTDNTISDISPVASLTNLTSLGLTDNTISDISPVASLTNLTSLGLSSNSISDISPVASLTNLTSLGLTDNTISDISPVASLTNLTSLGLTDNTISDISPVASLTNLTSLGLSSNSISDISPLSSLTNLTWLGLTDNTISDIETLERLMAQGTVVFFRGNPAFETPGPKIEDGWVWLVVPTGVEGSAAARSGRDFLSEASGGTVTEADVARNGATVGTQVGDNVWTAATLNPTNADNLTTIVRDYNLGTDIRYPVAYGVVSIRSETPQQTRVYIGAGPVKVWLNGTLVHKNTDIWSGSDYETAVPVMLNAGDNLLFIAAYRDTHHDIFGGWGAFFGFQDGTRYTVPVEEVVYMYWIDSGTDKIQRANLDGSNVQDIVTTGLRTPTNISLDPYEMYWVDSGTDKIQRANLDGSNIEDVVTTGLRTPTGVELDTFWGYIYWIDSGTDKIQYLDLGDYSIGDLVTTGLRTPTDIALDPYDPQLGKVYWIDSGTDKIQRVNFDGSNIQDLVTEGLRTPTSIALDLVRGKMYWTDSGTDKIQRANLDGSNIEDLVTTGLRTPTGIEVHPEGGKMYWIDSGTDKIQRADLDGSNIEDLVTTGLRTPTGIALTIPQIASSDPPPDPPPGPGPGPDPGAVDVNGDGQVTVIDLAIVALFYGTQVAAGAVHAADVNDDGTVDILDLTAVAEAIDAADTVAPLSADDVAAVLEAIADIEAIAEAPARFSRDRTGIAHRNVAAAFADAKHLATEDARLGKWMPLLKELLHRLSEMREIPDITALLANYPNPFNPETWIPYHLAQDANVTLTIYDVSGKAVRELPLGHQSAGVYESRGRAAYWDGKNRHGEPVASGVYFYTLTAGDFTATRKLLVAK